MIIKSHIRGGYRAAADYLKDQGQNEKTRLVQISDPDARNLDEAFQNMWAVACNSKVQKPLHHISINPYKDERLTDEQVLKIVQRCEEKYGYKSGNHQRVIVEHIKDGRQHFHVMWNRVSLTTGKAVWPGHHWKKSKQAAREMETELGLKRPMPKKMKRVLGAVARSGKSHRYYGRYQKLGLRRTKESKATSSGQIKSWRMSKVDHPAARRVRPPKSTKAFPVTMNRRAVTPRAITGFKPFVARPSKGKTIIQQRLSLPQFGSSTKYWQMPRMTYVRGFSIRIAYTAPFAAAKSFFNIFWLARFRTTHSLSPINQSMPQRPAAHGGMSKAQLDDLKAAIEGKMSWAEYFQKWGGGGLSL